MTVSNSDKVAEFKYHFGAYYSLDTAFDLIVEEYGELLAEHTAEDFDIKKAAKEATDLLYVTYGYIQELGVDPDLTFKAVHESNMSKLGDDGKPIYREDGKVMKGPNYKPPTFDWITK